ncbi:MAG: hypothetical protein ACYDB7_13445 [Mycobacteriales bacterium]
MVAALRLVWAVPGAPTGKRPEPRRRCAGAATPRAGSLLRDAIGIRTWADWGDALPGFAAIEQVGHEGGNAVGEHVYPLTVTDLATGPAENRSVPGKDRKWVIAALQEICGEHAVSDLGRGR